MKCEGRLGQFWGYFRHYKTFSLLSQEFFHQSSFYT